MLRFGREECGVVLFDFLDKDLGHPLLVSSEESVRLLGLLLDLFLGDRSSLDELFFGVSKGQRHSWRVVFCFRLLVKAHGLRRP